MRVLLTPKLEEGNYKISKVKDEQLELIKISDLEVRDEPFDYSENNPDENREVYLNLHMSEVDFCYADKSFVSNSYFVPYDKYFNVRIEGNKIAIEDEDFSGIIVGFME